MTAGVTARGRGAGLGDRLRVAALALLVLAAPTVGDIGGCGQAIEDLDPARFFAEKRRIDCQQCMRCAFATESCARACFGEQDLESFEQGCYPLVHDGEACLNALRAASCDEYAAYVDDLAPRVPTECSFCPLDQRPEGGS